MRPLLSTLLLTASLLAGGALLSSCANTGNSGGSASDGAFSAPAPVSPVEATERMRSKYRDWVL